MHAKPTHGQGYYELNDAKAEYRSWLNFPLGVFESMHGEGTIHDLEELKNAFVYPGLGQQNRYYSSNEFWYHLQFANLTDENEWILNLGNVDHATLFTSNLDSVSSGNLVHRDARPIKHDKLLIPLEIPVSDSTDFYIRFTSTGTVPLNLTLSAAPMFIESFSPYTSYAGIVKGIFLTLFLYHFLLFILTREPIFGWGAAFLLANCLYLSFFYSKWRWAELWPGGGYWMVHAEFTLYLIGILLFLQFSRVFLNLQGVFRRIILVDIVIGVILLLLSLGNLLLVLKPVMLYWCLASIGYVSVIVILLSYRGIVAARYFLISWVAFVIMIVLSGMYRAGILGINMPAKSWEVWFSIGFVFLAVSIAFRYNLQRWERDRALLAKVKVEKERYETRLKVLSGLHDDITASLSAIAQMSDLIDEKSTENRLSVKIGNIARTVNESIREVIWGIDPNKRHVDHILIRFKDTAEDLLGGYKLELNVHREPIRMTLTPTERINMLRIYKEAIQNIIKHSEATEVRIELINGPASFGFTVEDNGIGFTGEELGYGIKGMHQRASTLGAEFKLVQGEAGGIIIRCLLKKDANASV